MAKLRYVIRKITFVNYENLR